MHLRLEEFCQWINTHEQQLVFENDKKTFNEKIHVIEEELGSGFSAVLYKAHYPVKSIIPVQTETKEKNEFCLFSSLSFLFSLFAFGRKRKLTNTYELIFDPWYIDHPFHIAIKV